jgi:hypothetical protein
LDLAFFSEGSFLPAYVFLGAVSAFFAVGDLAPIFGGLEVAADFLTALVEVALVGAVFADGALRPEEDLVVLDFPVVAFAFDPGLAAGFAGVFAGVVLVFEVFEAGLFWDDEVRVGQRL